MRRVNFDTRAINQYVGAQHALRPRDIELTRHDCLERVPTGDELAIAARAARHEFHRGKRETVRRVREPSRSQMSREGGRRTGRNLLERNDVGPSPRERSNLFRDSARATIEIPGDYSHS